MIGLGTIASAVVATLFGLFALVVFILVGVFGPLLVKEVAAPAVRDRVKQYPRLYSVLQAFGNVLGFLALIALILIAIYLGYSIGYALLSALF